MKWCIREFRFYELPAMEKWFQQMAEKGWLIHTISGGNFFRFEKIEPAKLTFSVKVIGNMSLLSAENCEVAMDYRGYCEQAGWKFLCSNRMAQVFCAPAEAELVPIETDEELEFEAVWKQTRKQVIAQSVLAAFWLFWALYVPSVESLLRNYDLYSRLLILVLSLFFLADNLRGIVWYLKGRKALKEYKKVVYYGEDGRKFTGNLMPIAEGIILLGFLFYLLNTAKNSGFQKGLYLFLYFAVYLTFILVLQWLIRKKGFSKGAYAGITIVGAVVITFSMMGIYRMIENSGIPDDFLKTKLETEWLLTEVDLGKEPFYEENKELKFTTNERSFLGSVQDYDTYSGEYTFSYLLYETRYEWLQEKLREELLTPYKQQYDDVYRSYVTEPEGTIREVAVSRIYDCYNLRETGEELERDFRGYLLEMDEKLLYLSFSGEFALTEEEILDLAAERLKLC